MVAHAFNRGAKGQRQVRWASLRQHALQRKFQIAKAYMVYKESLLYCMETSTINKKLITY